MQREQIKNINNFLEDWPTEDSLLSPIMNSIKHNRFESGSVKFLFCDNKEEKGFWVQNIGRFVHLYIFSTLTEWSHQYDLVTEERRKNFLSFYKEAILSEMSNFISQIDIIPKSIHSVIGVIIDAYFWEENMDTPYLSIITRMPQKFSHDIYQQYRSVLETYLTAKGVDYLDANICKIINYLNATDVIIGKAECFLLLLRRMSGFDNNTSISTILKLISHNRCSFDTFRKIICFYIENYNIYKEDSYFSFCNSSKEFEFWKKNSSNYSFALLYFVLQEWRCNDETSIELNWRGLFSNDSHTIQMEQEMKSLKTMIVDKSNSLPKAIVENIGFMIEDYCWKKYNEVPSLITIVVFSSSFVEKYQRLLLCDVKDNLQNFINKIDCFLQFCLILDSNATYVRSNLLELLELTCNNESEKLENILELYPYYGDDFGLTLLQFCQQNHSVYKLSKQAISKYKYHLFVDSWMSVIHKRLEENGKPYSIELCERTSSYMRIIEYLESRHFIFWDKCERSTTQVINDIRKESPRKMRDPVRDNVQAKTKEISIKEKEIIYNNIKSFLSNTLKEGIHLFINETKEQEEGKGKKIELTEDVFKVVYKNLVDNYANKPLPDFSFDTTSSFYWYADRVARVWVFWRAGLSDYINSSASIRDEQRESIKEKFDTFVWGAIKSDVLAWCRSYYRVEDSSCASTDSMLYDNSYYDDNDLKGSERVG
jgi:hypothetical protein